MKNLLLDRRIDAQEAAFVLREMCDGVRNGDLHYVPGFNPVVDKLLAWIDSKPPHGEHFGPKQLYFN